MFVGLALSWLQTEMSRDIKMVMHCSSIYWLALRIFIVNRSLLAYSARREIGLKVILLEDSLSRIRKFRLWPGGRSYLVTFQASDAVASLLYLEPRRSIWRRGTWELERFFLACGIGFRS